MVNKVERLIPVALSVLLIVMTGCNSTGNNSSPSSEWLIPSGQIQDGGPGRDGIPSVDDPKFIGVDQVGYIVDDRLVVGVKKGDEVKAYPHQVLDWHEIVNDEIGRVPFALTYCPLTGTAIGWNREVEGEVTSFGVSGLLFRNNLIPFDRATGSEWSQMQMRGVRGKRAGTQIETIDVVEMPWSTWKEMYPDSKVMSTQTGFARPYQDYAYGELYLTGDIILFPIENFDDRLPRKERVHGFIADPVADLEATAAAYQIDEFGEGVHVVRDTVEQQELILVGSSDLNFAASFKPTIDGITLQFEAVQDDLPVVMEDNEGNKWNVFGEAVLGPRTGQKLTPTNSYTGYWFAWAGFFPDLEIRQ